MRPGARATRTALSGCLLAAGFLTVWNVAGSRPSGAATTVKLYVATTGSGTACTKTSPCGSIGDALTAAATHAGESVIVKVAAGAYDETDVISAGSLQSLTIAGAGSTATMVDGGNHGTVFTIVDGTVGVSGLTIENGHATGSAEGGGINNAATLTVSASILSSDHSDADGGAIFNRGSLTLWGSTLRSDTAGTGGGGIENTAQLAATGVSFQHDTAGEAGGGAIANTSTGTATVSDSTLHANRAPFQGGAIFNAGTLDLDGSAVTGNSAKGGGAISNDGALTVSSSTLGHNTGTDGGAIESGGTLIVQDSTLVDNGAQFGGGVNATGSVNLRDSTLSGNATSAGVGGGSGGGALSFGDGTLTLIGSTLANNTGPQIINQGSSEIAASIVADTAAGQASVAACQNAGTISDLGYDLTDDTSCGLVAPTDVDADPQLASLGPNGGPTWTSLPMLGSPATGAIPVGATDGSTQLCGRDDQRGVASSGNCTIGAVEGGFLIETPTLPDAVPGRVYAPTQLAVQNEGSSASPYRTSLRWKGVQLPSWLSLSSTGVLSGITPRTEMPGTQSITVSATEAVKTLNGDTVTKTKTTVEAVLPLTVSIGAPSETH